MSESARAAGDLSQFWLHDLDPVLLDLGALELRYYGLCFFLMFLTGYTLWRGQMLRGGHSLEAAGRIIPYGVVGVVVGGRLIHCLFYEPTYYLADPLAILDLRRSGLASHGSVLGLLTALWLYGRIYGFSLFEIADRLGFALMPAGAFVRLGNFLNSGIVGAEWDGPWAVRFQHFAARSQAVWEHSHGALGWTAQPLPRHPVQLYEGAGMLAIFVLLWGIDRRLGERRPLGLIVGVVLVFYFGFRFWLEELKEFQRFTSLQPDAADHVIHVLPAADVTMGQWLSVPGIAIGVAIVAYALYARRPAAAPAPSDPAPVA